VIGLFLTDYLLNVAYTMIPVGYVTMIHFMYPSLVCIAMAVIFREKLNGWKAAAMVCSAAGLAFLAGGGFTGRPAGILVAFLTGVAYAFYMIASQRPLQRGWAAGVHKSVLFQPFRGAHSTVRAAAGADGGAMIFPRTGGAWLSCLAVGAMLCAGTYLINIGIIRLGAGTASFINMVEPITSLAVSAAVYRYRIGALNLLGCALILGSLAFAARGDSKAAVKSAG
jgi:drug/metabolite transporter (DMT)-like permease